jgi:hypothetical protein
MTQPLLITRQEVIDYAEYRDAFPTTAVKLIAEVERWEFEKRLGWDFYEAMLADLTDTSTAVKYVPGTYDTGDIVIYNQKYYTCLRGNVTSQPPTLLDWKETEKFKSDCYNSIWCNYIARYLALCVIQNHKPTALLSMAQGHLVQPLGSDFQAPTKAAIDLDLRGIEQLRQKAYDNLVSYVKRVNASTDTTKKTCYAIFRKNSDSIATPCGGCDPCGTSNTTTTNKRTRWA